MTRRSAIYEGQVVHVRSSPRAHRLNYRVFSLFLDLDELPELSRNSRMFGHNRRAVFSFWDSDHGAGEARGLRAWVDKQISAAGLDSRRMRVGVLCYPRIFGYVFNPLTVYFCHDDTERLRLVIYEVCNTFAERHSYLIPVQDDTDEPTRHECAKELYVSPFLSMDCRYRFTITPPAERVRIAIDETEAGNPVLYAAFAGSHRHFSDKSLLRLLIAYPLMTLKVTGAIHFEALKLWFKGVPFHKHQPAQNPVDRTIIPVKAKAFHHEPH